MCKKSFNKIKAWDFNCEPKKLGEENFVEVSAIPLELPSGLTWGKLEEIIENQPESEDCCCNSGGLWHDGDKKCWFTGSRRVAEELVKLGATIPEIQSRQLVKV
ncbi:hypothetical protein K9M48_02505 [Candidatus Gracilibacteria bacterium]|nr:hypothetical protein [Candidatus Gracilibacteria bacterium]